MNELETTLITYEQLCKDRSLSKFVKDNNIGCCKFWQIEDNKLLISNNSCTKYIEYDYKFNLGGGLDDRVVNGNTWGNGSYSLSELVECLNVKCPENLFSPTAYNSFVQVHLLCEQYSMYVELIEPISDGLNTFYRLEIGNKTTPVHTKILSTLLFCDGEIMFEKNKYDYCSASIWTIDGGETYTTLQNMLEVYKHKVSNEFFKLEEKHKRMKITKSHNK